MLLNVIKTKKHSSCEIEVFVQVHVCELCAILLYSDCACRSECVLSIGIGGRLPFEVPLLF